MTTKLNEAKRKSTSPALIFSTYLLLLLPAVVPAQHELKKGGLLIDGAHQLTGGDLYTGRGFGFYFSSSLQYFVSPQLNIGGRLLLTGLAGSGPQSATVAPQLFGLDQC